MPGINGLNGANGLNGLNEVERSSSLKTIDLNDENLQKVTDMKNLEGVKAETTGHKAGRIIAGILGGLLLAAGIAAAAVAVTATLGVAVGVLGAVAAFAGITATSITAGAAGCAGIALIATSAHMAPGHPEVPAEHGSGDAEKALEEKRLDFLKKGVSEIANKGAVKFTDEDLSATSIKMNKLHIHYDPEEFGSNVFMFCMNVNDKLKNSDGNDLISIVRDNKIDLVCASFVKDTLTNHNINSLELNADSILTVRRSMQQFFCTMVGNKEYGALAEKLQDGNFQQKFAESLIQTLGTRRNGDDRKAVEIFIAAIAIRDLDELGTAFKKEEENLMEQRIFG